MAARNNLTRNREIHNYFPFITKIFNCRKRYKFKIKAIRKIFEFHELSKFNRHFSITSIKTEITVKNSMTVRNSV